MKFNPAEALLERHIMELLPGRDGDWEREATLVKGRRFRWDFRFLDLAVEIHGGRWMKKGAHNTGQAIARDCEKTRLAVMAGFKPVAFVPEEVMDGTAKRYLADYLDAQK